MEGRSMTETEKSQKVWRSAGYGDVKHWGVWHPTKGWSYGYGIVFSTTHRAIAEAQCAVVQKMGFKNWELWEVRCIEEWADERQT